MCASMKRKLHVFYSEIPLQIQINATWEKVHTVNKSIQRQSKSTLNERFAELETHWKQVNMISTS